MGIKLRLICLKALNKSVNSNISNRYNIYYTIVKVRCPGSVVGLLRILEAAGSNPGHHRLVLVKQFSYLGISLEIDPSGDDTG